MTDQPDDTLLDDDVEEHDFNFDNEKEEALLAENEFDTLIEEQPNEDVTEQSIEPETEHLDQEEDVLDIGIAEEDIENELISIPNVVHEPIDITPENESILHSDSVPVAESDVDKHFESEQTSNVTDVESNADKHEDECEPRLSIGDGGLSDDEKNILSESLDKLKDDEGSSKPKVISLKKHDKKSYDDLPDLAKVIELVQPHGSSRHRKHGKVQQPFVKKNRSGDVVKVNKSDNYNERNDTKFDNNSYRSNRDGSRSNDDPKRSYDNFNDRRCDSVEIINRSQRVTEEHGFHNFVEYKNFSSQSFLPRNDMQVENPIVATVQITQERYQIAGDFQIIRPMQNSSCQQIIRPFDQTRMFHPKGGLPPNPHIPRPPGQFPGNGFQSGRPPMHLDSTDYHRPGFLPPRPPHPMPRRPLLPPPGAGLPPQPIRQRFPPPGPPAQHFPPPFPNNTGPPPGAPYHHNYHQNRSQFSPNAAPFPQNFSRPPPFSQPPPPLGSANGPCYTNPPAAAPYPGYQNRPPPPTNSNGNFQPAPRMPNDGMHSVVFQQSSQRIIRMPPPHGHDGNPHRITNNSIMQNSSNDYYLKESVISSSTSVSSSSPYLPPPTGQPPPGAPPYQSIPPGGHYADSGSHMRNNQVEYSRFNDEDYYADQSGDKYSYHAKSDYPSTSERMTDDRNHTSNYSKRISSSMDDNVSPKRSRYNYSNNKPEEDDEMEAYRKKVEHQKKQREQFVQMKEEQRLKNQMQNFIQNNIKGVLQRREQFLRKNETENNPISRTVNVKKKEDIRIEDTERRNVSGGNTTDRIANSPPRKQFDKKPLNPARNTGPGDKARIPVMKRLQGGDDFKPREALERMKVDDNSETTKNTKQLHKVVKIKYKDGTVALKSFPVTGPTKRNVTSMDKSNSVDSINVTVHDEDNVNLNRRRMVVSKQSSLTCGENNEGSSRNENIIVESVRKGVTQSSVPLAQRFSNLKPNHKDEHDEDSSIRMKSKNRLVISDEEKTRTVWIKNISTSTKTTLIQKIASTCGTITKMKWIAGSGQFNQAKITFSKSEEAKKFIHNYHRKTIDTSLILVSSISDTK